MSWSSDLNMTFDNLLKNVLTYKIDHEADVIAGEVENSIYNPRKYFLYKKFYPSFQGYCWNLYTYNTSNSLVLKSKTGNETRFKVYITDKNLETFVSKHKNSHQGQTIQIDSAHRYRYEVTVQLVSNFDPRQPEACVNYKDNEFEECVDKNFQHYVKPLIKCNPPWLSRKSQCLQVIKNLNISDDNFKAYNGKLKPILYNEKIEAIQECKPGKLFMKKHYILKI